MKETEKKVQVNYKRENELLKEKLDFYEQDTFPRMDKHIKLLEGVIDDLSKSYGALLSENFYLKRQGENNE